MCRTTQPLLLTLLELCVLVTSTDQRGEIALNAMLRAMEILESLAQDAFVAQKGVFVLSNFSTRWSAGPAWHSGPNHLDVPALQDLVRPVLRDAVLLLAPVLLPAFQLNPLPSEVPQQEVLHRSGGSVRVPQQLMMLAGSGVCVHVCAG